MSMDKQHVTLLVMLDLSAAFHTVCHSTLISRLESKFGVKGAALEWVCSYLLGRTQRVSVKGAVSENFDLRHGVPQGSCLVLCCFPFIPPSYLTSPNNTCQTLSAMLTTHSCTCHSALMNLLVLKGHLLRCLTAFEILELGWFQTSSWSMTERRRYYLWALVNSSKKWTLMPLQSAQVEYTLYIS